jgi:hypothetical protein
LTRHLKVLTILVCGFLAILLAIGATIYAYPRLKTIDKPAGPPQIVSAVLPLSEDAVGDAITRAFNVWSEYNRPSQLGHYQNKFPANSIWSRFFLFPRSEPVFPSDQEIAMDGGVDLFVARYLDIPAAQRAQDFYLYEPTHDYYWDSEYFYNTRPARFRCGFLIHLEPVAAAATPAGAPAAGASTRVEIYEFQPLVWAGEYWGFSASSFLPAKVHDIRPVDETTSDRKTLLDMISQAASTPAAAN